MRRLVLIAAASAALAGPAPLHAQEMAEREAGGAAAVTDRDSARARLIEAGYTKVVWIRTRPDGTFEAMVERDGRRYRRIVHADGRVTAPGS